MKQLLLIFTLCGAFLAASFASERLGFTKGIDCIDTLVSLKTADIHSTVFLADTNRGGLFRLVDLGATNNGTAFASTDSATKMWQRVFSGPVNIKWFGAVGDGVADDVAAINAAIDFVESLGGGHVVLAEGTNAIGSPIILKTGVLFSGQGTKGTLVKLLAGSNCNVLETEDFVANNTAQPSEAPHSFRISDMTIDGNADNQTSGGGIAIYGCRYVLDQVNIQNVYGDGFYSNYTISGRPADLDNISANGGGVESHIGTIRIEGCKGNGFHFLGPHDSTADRIVVQTIGQNDGTNVIDCTVGSTHAAGILLESTAGNGGSLAVDYAHAYAVFGTGFKIKGGSSFCKANYIVVDACYEHGFWTERDHTHVGNLHAFKNNRSLGDFAHVYVDADECILGSVFVDHRWSSTVLTNNPPNGGTGLWINGARNVVAAFSGWGASTEAPYGGTGMRITAGGNQVHNATIYDWTENGSVGVHHGAGSQLIFNRIGGNIYNCVTNWWTDQGGSGSKLNTYNFSLQKDTSGQTLFVGDGPQLDADGTGLAISDRWNVSARDNTATTKLLGSSSTHLLAVALTNDLPVSTVIAHRLLTTPNIRGIHWNSYITSGTNQMSLLYGKISSITATSFTFTYQLASTNAGSGWINFDMRLTP